MSVIGGPRSTQLEPIRSWTLTGRCRPVARTSMRPPGATAAAVCSSGVVTTPAAPATAASAAAASAARGDTLYASTRGG